MSLWNKLLDSGPEIREQIRAFYGKNFPIQVRHHLADWLESKLL
jgi:signal transducer and activator of transcription 5B